MVKKSPSPCLLKMGTRVELEAPRFVAVRPHWMGYAPLAPQRGELGAFAPPSGGLGGAANATYAMFPINSQGLDSSFSGDLLH